ncbi:hypothetical protein CFP56_009722 [Quercus suber]|uniref:Uncharacterized protein n=1 Tax=Quercus suber TaxID=58331 RepID=A0AAW0L4J8_QUESU
MNRPKEAFENGDALFHENTKLKQAVAIQHELQKEYEKQNLELQQLVSQYQIGLRNLQILDLNFESHSQAPLSQLNAELFFSL